MELDHIAIIEIGEDGRLHVGPTARDFPFAYREAMEVYWDPHKRMLVSPPPREWSYLRWLQQILAVASAQGVELTVSPQTQWLNVPVGVRVEIMAALHAA